MIGRKRTSAGAGPHADREFPPHALRDYALLPDGARGEIAWLCAPPAFRLGLFLADRRSRHLRDLSCRSLRWGGFYEPRSLISRSPSASMDFSHVWLLPSRSALIVGRSD